MRPLRSRDQSRRPRQLCRCQTTGRLSAPSISRIASRSPAASISTAAATTTIPTPPPPIRRSWTTASTSGEHASGLLGKFFEDWNYALIYDFGGSSDGFGGTAAVGPAPGTPVGFLPGGATSGIENAYLSYTG